MKYIINTIRLVLIAAFAGIGSSMGLIVLLFTFSTDKCINTAVGIFSRLLFFICGVKLESYGGENLTKSPGKVYVSNHESHFDPPALALACPYPLYFIAKKELRYVPFIGWYIWISGMIFIDRKNKSKSQESIRKAGEKVKKGKNVISFAEGTRSKPGELLKFKRGAFTMAQKHELDIVPVGISGTGDILSSGSIMIKPNKTIKVSIGEVMKFSEHSHLSTDELAKKCRDQVKLLVDGLKENK